MAAMVASPGYVLLSNPTNGLSAGGTPFGDVTEEDVAVMVAGFALGVWAHPQEIHTVKKAGKAHHPRIGKSLDQITSANGYNPVTALH
jgi:hypothetical protein